MTKKLFAVIGKLVAHFFGFAAILSVFCWHYEYEFVRVRERITAERAGVAATGGIHSSSITQQYYNGVSDETLLRIINNSQNRSDIAIADRASALAKADEIARELGITQEAILAFFRALRIGQVQPSEIRQKLVEITDIFLVLQRRLVDFVPNDRRARQLVASAQRSIDSGNFAEADAFMQDAFGYEQSAAQLAKSNSQSQNRFVNSLLSAASISAARGRLAALQLRHNDAAKFFSEAWSPLQQIEPSSAFFGVVAHYYVKYRIEEGNSVYEHALLSSDLRMFRRSVNLLSAVFSFGYIVEMEDYSKGQSNLGHALLFLYKNNGDESLLNESILAFELATRERALPLFGDDYTKALLGYGEALARRRRVGEAVAIFRQSLLQCGSCSANPQFFLFETQLHLIFSLIELADLDGSAEPAIEAHKRAVEVMSTLNKETDKSRWVRGTLALSAALRALGERHGRIDSLNEAVSAARLAINNLSIQIDQNMWAQAHLHLGRALEGLVIRGAANPSQAADAYNVAIASAMVHDKILSNQAVNGRNRVTDLGRQRANNRR